MATLSFGFCPEEVGLRGLVLQAEEEPCKEELSDIRGVPGSFPRLPGSSSAHPSVN